MPLDPKNTDNLQNSNFTETDNIYAVELVTLANGILIMITSERDTATDGISTYQIDNDPDSATYGQIIGTVPNGSGSTDLGAKIDSISGNGGALDGYDKIADLAAVTLSNGQTYVYTADDSGGAADGAIGLARIEDDGSLTNLGHISTTNTHDMKELTIAEVGGQPFLIGLNGTSSTDALTVYQINDDGSLSQTDVKFDQDGAGENFLDGQDPFNAASVLESYTYNGTSFVVAGGAEDGVSLWTLDGNGDLTFRDARGDNETGRAGDVNIGSAHTGLNDPDAAAFGEVGGTLYMFVGGRDDDVTIFRIGNDLDANNNPVPGTWDTFLVGQADNVAHDISSMAFLPDGDGGKLVVGGEQQGLKFFDIVQNADGSVSLNLVSSVDDENDTGAELLDSEDIAVAGGILVSASDNDDGVAVITTGLGASDGPVDGEDSAETMELGYDDSNAPTDQGGDVITNDDDLIYGNGGNDTIDAEGGDDLVFGGAGDDSIEGNDGADTLFGDGNQSTAARESFNWNVYVEPELDNGTTVQDTGTANVAFTRTFDNSHHASNPDTHTEINVSGIDAGDEVINSTSSLKSVHTGSGGRGDFQWVFSEPVSYVNFNVSDIDWGSVVTIRAFDQSGNVIDVELDAGSSLTLAGNTVSNPATSSGAQSPTSDGNNLQVSIDGPVSRIELVHTTTNGGAIHISDIFFTAGNPEVAGDDTLSGGEGDDLIFGDNGDVTSTPADGGFDPVNTDNLQNSSGTETNNIYAVELVTLANGDLVMISSERCTYHDNGISSYKLDNDPASSTYGQIIGTTPTGDGHDDLSAKIDTVGMPTGNSVGYNNTSDLAAVTLANGETFVYSADFHSDAIGVTKVNPDGSLDAQAPLQSSADLDKIKELEIAEVGGAQYLMALSTGHSDKLMVFRIEDDGSLTQTDIKSDGSGAAENFLNGGSHFSSTSLLESFTNSAGETFVLAGGDDDGISLWTLDGNGDLTFENARGDNQAGTGESDPQGNALSRDVIQPEYTGLKDVEVAAFGEIDGETYVFTGGKEDSVDIWRVDADASGDGTFDLTLVGQTPDVTVHDISSMAFLPDGDGGKLVVGGEQSGLKFYDITTSSGGQVTLTEVATVDDENDPGAELWDSEDIDIEGGILVSASDNDDGVAVITTGLGQDDGSVAGGDDVIAGGLGADTMFGEGGDDRFVVSSSAAGAGDVIDGGNGPDETADHDVLDLTGAGSVIIDDAVDANDDGATAGTVTFEDGATLTFAGIEQIITDPDNTAPDAINDTATTPEDTAVVLTPLDNDTDVDSDDLMITSASVPAALGTVEIAPDGKSITFTPAPDYNGPATISYGIDDGNGGTDVAEIVVDVTPVNDAPVALDDLYETPEDTAITFDPTENDSDVDGDDLTVVDAQLTDPAQGTVEVNSDGTVTFTPATDLNGPVEITYTVEDPDGAQDTGTSIVNVGEAPDAPTANDDTATTPEDTPVVISPLGNDTDPDGDALTITFASVPADQGTVTFTDDTITFTPAQDFTGDATITYAITDGNGGTDTADVDVTVTPVNDAPVAIDDIVTTPEDTVITFDPVANDIDPDGDDLTLVDAQLVDPATGVLTFDSSTNAVTFTPATDFSGPVEITYTVEDPDGEQATGTSTVNVGAVNDAPIAEDDTATTDQGTPVDISPLVNDSDPDGDDIRVISAATVPPAQGTVTFTDDVVTFTPAEDFVGVAEITYTISDGGGLTDTATVQVTVEDVIGPVDGTDLGEEMLPDDYADAQGDQIDGTDGDNDTIFGNGGDDTIDGGAGNDTIDGGDDDDLITGGVGDDVVLGGDGSDTLAGGDGDDRLEGGLGDDDIAVNDGDTAAGGSGDDVFTLDGTDPTTDIDDVTIDGGTDGTDGNADDDANGNAGDILDLSDQSNDLQVIFDDADPENGTVDGLDTDGAVDLTFEEIEKVITGSGDDVIDGEDGVGPIDVSTNAGDDTIIGTDGNDTVDGGADNDSITTGDGNDSIDGGDGDNIIDTSGPSSTDPNDPTGKPDQGYPGLFTGDDDPDNDKDTVTTGSGNDNITTGDDDDVINAGDGQNVIDAGFDDDTITTGSGDDVIVGGEGNDSIDAGAGDDLVYAGNDPSVSDAVNIPDEDLGTLNPLTPDLLPNNGVDTVSGGEGNDTIFGADDADLLMGGAGDDVLNGGIDNDTLMGGTGDDVLIGGQGEDSMSGGDGEDTFVIADPNDPFYQAGSGVGDVVDGGAGGTPVASNTAAPNEDWDILDLTGSAPEGGSLQVAFSGPDSNGNGQDGTVTYRDANGNITGTLDFTEIEQVIPCFTLGTLIATPKGEFQVQDLQVGDRVITRDDGIQEIAWIGKKRVTAPQMRRDPKLQPVLIKQGALGNGLPERDMMVSPNHRMLIANQNTQMLFNEHEVLVAAKHLVGQPGIHVLETLGTEYIHVMFERHQVILGDGAWTESFQPGDMTMGGFDHDQRAELTKLFPSLADAKGRQSYASARHSLKAFEARTLKESSGYT